MMVGTLRDVTDERLAANREAAVLAMTDLLAQAASGRDVLEAGLAELRRHWNVPRVLAAVWNDDDNPAELVSAPAGIGWADLPGPVRQRIGALRDQPPLQISTAPGSPSWAGTAVEYSGSVAGIWVDLDGCPPFGVEDRTLLALLCGSLGQALNRARLLDQEREVALALQHAVLGPGRMPPGFAARYEPATPPLEIGGDWYDVAELPGRPDRDHRRRLCRPGAGSGQRDGAAAQRVPGAAARLAGAGPGAGRPGPVRRADSRRPGHHGVLRRARPGDRAS